MAIFKKTSDTSFISSSVIFTYIFVLRNQGYMPRMNMDWRCVNMDWEKAQFLSFFFFLFAQKRLGICVSPASIKQAALCIVLVGNTASTITIMSLQKAVWCTKCICWNSGKEPVFGESNLTPMQPHPAPQWLVGKQALKRGEKKWGQIWGHACVVFLGRGRSCLNSILHMCITYLWINTSFDAVTVQEIIHIITTHVSLY